MHFLIYLKTLYIILNVGIKPHFSTHFNYFKWIFVVQSVLLVTVIIVSMVRWTTGDVIM